MPTQHTRVVMVAGQLGSTGATLLKLLAEHRVLEIPTVSIGLGLHPDTVRESFHRLARHELVVHVRSRSNPTRATRWYLTALGARVAWTIRSDKSWDPRPVASHRSALATEHDLALAWLRLVIFRSHWQEFRVQRGRGYLSNGPLVKADVLFRKHLESFDRGATTVRPSEPEVRYLARRRLGLGVHDPVPEEKAVLIPDLFWPGSAEAPPVIVEYEGSRAHLRTVRQKARHLSLYCCGRPETQVAVVYPSVADRQAMEGRWRKALSSSREGAGPSFLLTSMAELNERRGNGSPLNPWDLPGRRIGN